MKKQILTLTLAIALLHFIAFAQTGLLGSYPFSGNANDVSGNGNNGIVNGAILTADRFGNANNAYFFSGNDYIDLSNNFSYNSHSFSAWVKLYSFPSINWYEIISKVCQGTFDFYNSELRIWEFNDVPEYVYGTGSSWGSVVSQISLDTIQWFHIVSTYNSVSNQVKIYVNSTAIDSAIIVGYADTNACPIYVGARPTTIPQFFMTGYIDDINIYNRVLTQNEIDSLFNITLTNVFTANYFPHNVLTLLYENNFIHFTSQNENKIKSLSIYNMLGELVFQKKIMEKEFSFSTVNYPKSIYFYSAIMDDGTEYEGKVVFY